MESTNLKKSAGQKRRTSQVGSPNGNDTSASLSDRSYKKDNQLQIVWRNVALLTVLNLICLGFIYGLITRRIRFETFIFGYVYSIFGGFGITAGAHRLWAHRSYTANLPLRIFLMLAQSAALQTNIHEWTRDHRVHHKFTDTDADPHNVSRGFFFAHMGWLLCKKHKDVREKGKTIDMSDVLADPVVKFQMKYYLQLVLVMNLIIPSLIPWYFWGESAWASILTSFGRYVISLHATWLVNSAAHFWGMKPYDKSIKPTENKWVSAIAYGEGWHNYHHVFPWDYKAAELGNYGLNFTTCFLDFMAAIGWATELKTASEDMIRKRIIRTGDESKQEKIKSHHHDEQMVWGWGDKDMDKEEIREIKKINRMVA